MDGTVSTSKQISRSQVLHGQGFGVLEISSQHQSRICRALHSGQAIVDSQTSVADWHSETMSEPIALTSFRYGVWVLFDGIILLLVVIVRTRLATLRNNPREHLFLSYFP